MNLKSPKMAAPYCTKHFMLLWQNSKTYSYLGTKRQFTLFCANQQKKKSSHTKLNDAEDLSAIQKSTQPQQRNSRGQKKVTSSQHSVESPEWSGVPVSEEHLLKAPSFKQILHERYCEAKRSIVIKTQNPESTIQSLISIGSIKHAHYISQDKAYILAEFANENSITKLQLNSSFFNEPNQFPMRTRILFDLSTRPHKNRKLVPQIDDKPWQERSSNVYPVMNTIGEELQELCIRKSLGDTDLRSRFFVCLQLEELLQSFLPNSLVIPYGSCLNGFGWWNSDLDMMLCFNRELHGSNIIRTPQQNDGRSTNFKILTEIFSSSRHLAQRTLVMVASLLELSPRVHGLFKILNARVPIVKFKNVALNLDCDVSIQAMDSIKMTELLYLYSVCDPRVKPLMTGIKQWAISQNMTSSGEQQKPTTIGLLMMLIYYLQTRPLPVIPTLRQLRSLASTSEMFYIDDIVYGLPSDPHIVPKSKNKESIENLLHGFFIFYSEFDFKSQAISIIEGSTFSKPADSTPVHIENPLCVGLNICRNVGKHQLEQFTNALMEAAFKLEQMAAQPDSGTSNLSTLFNNKHQRPHLSVQFSGNSATDHNVSVDIAELFADEDFSQAPGDNVENNAVEMSNHFVGNDTSLREVESKDVESGPPCHSSRASSIIHHDIQPVVGPQDDKQDPALFNSGLGIHDLRISDNTIDHEPRSGSTAANKTS